MELVLVITPIVSRNTQGHILNVGWIVKNADIYEVCKWISN